MKIHLAFGEMEKLNIKHLPRYSIGRSLFLVDV